MSAGIVILLSFISFGLVLAFLLDRTRHLTDEHEVNYQWTVHRLENLSMTLERHERLLEELRVEKGRVKVEPLRGAKPGCSLCRRGVGKKGWHCECGAALHRKCRRELRGECPSPGCPGRRTRKRTRA